MGGGFLEYPEITPELIHVSWTAELLKYETTIFYGVACEHVSCDYMPVGAFYPNETVFFGYPSRQRHQAAW